MILRSRFLDARSVTVGLPDMFIVCVLTGWLPSCGQKLSEHLEMIVLSDAHSKDTGHYLAITLSLSLLLSHCLALSQT